MKGDLLLASGGDPRVSAGLYRQAREIAAASEARMPRLRAQARLARLAMMSGGPADGELAELGRLYAAFDEGLRTADLVEARQLLEAAGAPA